MKIRSIVQVVILAFMLVTPIGYLHGSFYMRARGNSGYLVGVNAFVLGVETVCLSALFIFTALWGIALPSEYNIHIVNLVRLLKLLVIVY